MRNCLRYRQKGTAEYGYPCQSTAAQDALGFVKRHKPVEVTRRQRFCAISSLESLFNPRLPDFRSARIITLDPAENTES